MKKLSCVAALDPDHASSVSQPDDCRPHVEDARVVTEEDIRQRAYFKWEEAGRPEGRDVLFWFEAEREVNDLGL